MKTTLELPDDLLMEAKAMAVRRRTTLKSLIENSLRRELGEASKVSLPGDEAVEMGENGLPRLKKRGARITAATIDKIREEEGI